MADLLGICGMAVIIIGFFVALVNNSPSVWISYASGLIGAILIAGANHMNKLEPHDIENE